MIDTDENGQSMLEVVIDNVDSFEWTEWEYEFINSVVERDLEYERMSDKQKSVVSNLYDKCTR